MPKVKYLFAAFIITICSTYLPRGSGQSVQASTMECSDVEFIFARGSGESLQGNSETAWRSEITKTLENSTLKYRFYELGSVSQDGAQYPAAAVSGSFGGIINLLGAYVSAGKAFNFGNSVRAGQNELKNYLRKISSACPATKFVLGGYSQGAMLITQILPEIDASKIVYVANFGDPKTYLPEGKGSRPVACQGKNLSNYRAYVSDCHAYEGVLGSVRPYQPAGYQDKLGLWCNAHDIMCSSGINVSDHSAYTKRGLYQNAAQVILGKLQKTFPGHFQTAGQNQRSSHDMVILLNVGSSMDQILLAQYKSAARAIANQTRSLGGRVALYLYSDRNKLIPQEACNFACTAQEFDAELNKITSFLTTGENFESTLSTLRTAMQRLDWQVGATKSAVVLSPKPYSAVDRDGTTLNDVVELSLKIDPVNVYVLTDDDYTKERSTYLTDPTNGAVYDLRTELDQAIQEITTRPVVGLALEEYSGIVGDEFLFEATGSRNARFDWDLDADGIFETQNAGAAVQQAYQTPISGFIQVKVTDSSGTSSTMSAQLTVAANETASAKISGLTATKVADGSYQINFSTNADQVLLAIDDAILGFVETGFTLTDVTEKVTLQLIPYHDGIRGDRAELIIDPNIADAVPDSTM